MKRFVAILMAAAMLLTVLAGCSGSTKPADTTPAADSSTAAAETESAAPSASAPLPLYSTTSATTWTPVLPTPSTFLPS